MLLSSVIPTLEALVALVAVSALPVKDPVMVPVASKFNSLRLSSAKPSELAVLTVVVGCVSRPVNNFHLLPDLS